MGAKANMIRLSDDWHHDEPLGYLVKCFDTTVHEYRVFAEERAAKDFAFRQEMMASDAGEPTDWIVYPLYAGEPIDIRAGSA